MTSTNFKLGSQRKRRHKRGFVTLAAFLLLMGVAVISVVTVQNGRRIERNSSQKDQQKEVAKATEKSTSLTDGKDQSLSPGIDRPDTENIPQSQSLALNITSLNQVDSQVNAVAIVKGARAPGTCLFSFSSTDSKPVVKQVVSSEQPGNQSCSVTIPRVEFDKRGNWQLLLSFYSDGSKTTASQVIILE